MINMGRIGENIDIAIDDVTISSATARSRSICMEGADKALFVCHMGTAVGNLQPVLQLQQSANEFGTTWANITSATALIGSTASTRVDKAVNVSLTITSASTAGDVIDINGTTFTFATARSATGKEWGSTVDATAEGGLEQCSSSLATAINANLSSIMYATTASTSEVTVKLLDTANTYINAVSTGAITCKYNEAVAMIEINAGDLNSTSKYVSVSLGTVATAIDASIICIRSGNRYKPTAPRGAYTKM